MPAKESTLAAFLWLALVNETYPEVLYWYDEVNGIFILKCLRKNSDGWTMQHSKIFQDYQDLKARHSNDNRDQRARLLNALNASPYIKEIKGLSTANQRMYQFSQIPKIPGETVHSALDNVLSSNNNNIDDTQLEDITDDSHPQCNKANENHMNAEDNVSFPSLNTDEDRNFSFPHDYDPEQNLLESLKSVQVKDADSVKRMLLQESFRTSEFEIVGMSPVQISGKQLTVLEQNGLDTNAHGTGLFMLTIKPPDVKHA